MPGFGEFDANLGRAEIGVEHFADVGYASAEGLIGIGIEADVGAFA